MVLNRVVFSSKIMVWGTPLDFYQKLDEEFHFKCDPCTIDSNPLGCEVFYTVNDDGLSKSWVNPTYCNPPYGREISKWIMKAVEEQKRGVTTVMLLPVRTDTRYFHEYIYNKPNIEVRFLRGRLHFVGTEYQAPSPAPFPSMLVIFRKPASDSPQQKMPETLQDS